MDNFYDDDLEVRREVEEIFEEKIRKRRELGEKLLFQWGNERPEDESDIEEIIKERRLNQLISKLFYCGHEEPIKLAPTARPRVKPRGFLAIGAPGAVVACDNAFVESHVICAKCEEMRELVKSEWTNITCKYADMIDDDYMENVLKNTPDVLRLPTLGTGVELDRSSRYCHSCTIIPDSWLDTGGEELDSRFSCDFEEGRKSRSQSLLRSSNIRLEIPYIPGYAPGSGQPLSVDMLVVIEQPVQHIEPGNLLESSVRFESKPMDEPKPKISRYIYSRSPPVYINSISTASGESLKTIYTWFRDCRRYHKECGIHMNTSTPKRLPRVKHTRQGLIVRLVLTSTIPRNRDTSYAALSYCWGGQNTWKLTTATERTLFEGVPISRLPATIRDSAKVTKGLGLRWLWVDALCIFQDSKQDFQEQVGAMADVYLGCSVCIAAVGASKASDGLFSQRDPLKFAPCYMFPGDDEEDIWLRPSMQAAIAMDPWPLFLRAWALQERLLSPRTIKFGPYLSWECRLGPGDEFRYDLGFEYLDRMETLSNDFLSTFIDPPSSGIRHTSEKEMRHIWYLILQEYSVCNLTFKSDRLNAISGIISAIERRTGWENSNGLWLPFIVEEMLWETFEDQIRQPAKTRLWPSWSWISTDAYIKPHMESVVDEEIEHLELISRFEGVVDTKHLGFQKPLQCISLHCLALRVRRQLGLGKTGNRTESLIVVEDDEVEWMRIKFIKDFTESKVQPQLFLAVACREWPEAVEGLVVGLYPTSHKPYVYQRLGRGRCDISGLLSSDRLQDESLRKSFLLV